MVFERFVGVKGECGVILDVVFNLTSVPLDKVKVLRGVRVFVSYDGDLRWFKNGI